MKICLFDDSHRNHFFPIAYSRPIAHLRCGAFTLVEKWQILAGKDTDLHILTEDYLMEYFEMKKPASEEILYLNSRIIPFRSSYEKIMTIGPDQIFIHFDGSILACLSETGEFVPDIWIKEKRKVEVDLPVFNYIWDLIYQNELLLKDDFSYFGYKNFTAPSYVYLLQPEQIVIGENVELEPGVVLDARSGPVIIDDQSHIMAHSVIKGPAYIGKNCIVRASAKLYGHLSIGPVCKVGGEVAESIIQGYSNKQHDGFLGHAYLGEWCNLGADTNNSDLKNNYGEISVFLNGKAVNTGHRFLGLIMGDHSKSAINTSFNTGTIVGFSSNIFARGFVKKFVPSFSWMGDDLIRTYDLVKAKEVARIVMGRRNKTFTGKEDRLFNYLFQFTREIENQGQQK